MTQLPPVNEHSPGLWRVAKSRVSIDSVVIGYHRGESPEEIARDYRVLTVDEVKAAIAWYLDNREAVDESMRKTALKWEEFRKECAVKNADLHEKLKARLAAKAEAAS